MAQLPFTPQSIEKPGLNEAFMRSGYAREYMLNNAIDLRPYFLPSASQIGTDDFSAENGTSPLSLYRLIDGSIRIMGRLQNNTGGTIVSRINIVDMVPFRPLFKNINIRNGQFIAARRYSTGVVALDNTSWVVNLGIPLPFNGIDELFVIPTSNPGVIFQGWNDAEYLLIDLLFLPLYLR